ncbi:MAG: PQQ-binding-like beta-propeller repeat protein [Planctomycetes bacterium]|nr:PQQ-binding-like beta-propeller repeat protein [Planctomycetota bacterium]
MITRHKFGRCLLAALLFVALLQAVARADWPGFRGPRENGWATAPGEVKPLGLALHWSETQNVKWKTPIPHRGWSTPVVMNGQIWLTTATLEGNDFFVICVDADSGRIRFNEKIFHSDNPEPLGNNMNCYASPSPVIEAGRVYVHFGSYGTACLDTATCKVLWNRTDLPCRHYRGPGSSPVLFNDLLIVTMDGVDVQYVVALDKRTGKTVWKTDRTTEWDDLDDDGKPFREGDLRKAYCTPLIIDAGGQTQMISVGAKSAYSYDPANGREIWKVRYPGYSNAACPVFGNGLVYIITGFGKTELFAVRVDGRRDVTDTHIAWKTGHLVPRTPSPVLVDDLLFAVSDNGILICRDALTGEEIWQQRLKGNHAASPLYADGRIYCSNQFGTTTVFKAARECKLLATNKLDSGFMASPVVSGKALFLRTKTHLYRIQ